MVIRKGDVEFGDVKFKFGCLYVGGFGSNNGG